MGETRKKTRVVAAGNVLIGGENPIIIQSMCNTDTRNIESTVNQIHALEDAGCEMVRLAVPDMQAAFSIGKIKKSVSVPLVADIHFDYRLAVEAINQGIDKIRINPGNIGSYRNVQILADMAKEKHIPIRIGVNSGSLERELLKKFGRVTPEAMVESALGHVKILEDCGFNDIVISIKSSGVPFSIEAYRLLSQAVDYPLHIDRKSVV